MILGLKFPRWLLASSLVLLSCGANRDTSPPPPPPPPPAVGAGMAQVIGILDYVSSDYAGAVRDGQVISESEFREQMGLVEEATGLARRGGGTGATATVSELDALKARMEHHESPEAVREGCRSVRNSVVARYGLVLAPTTTPSLSRARELYHTNCELCHGADGTSQTPRAAELHPPPADLTSLDRMGPVAPYRAFHSITYGVRNTGMAAFDVYPTEDRWSLAYYAVGLQLDHADADPVRGRRIFQRLGRPVTPTAAGLSQITENELEATIARVVPNKHDQWDVLGYLRLVAPYEAPAGATFALARTLLDQGMTELRAGHRDGASRRVIASYLDGIEPHEAALRTRDAALTTHIEDAYVGLRSDLTHGASVTVIERRAEAINVLLDRAEGHRATGRNAAYVGSVVISLREGMEAALLVAALLSFVRRRGHASQLKYVHAGWMLALPAGVVTWLLVGAALSGVGRELTEGVVSLLAAAVLLMVSHWMLGRQESQRWLKFLERRVSDAGSRGARWALAGIAFGAVYREAFETVLFYRALMIDAAGHSLAVAAGAATGVGSLAALVFMIQRVGLKLKPRPFMLASSVVLSCMVLVFAGRGVRSLQEAGLVPLSPVSGGEVPWLGLYATREGLMLQGLIAGFLVATAVYSLLSGPVRTAPRTPRAAGEGSP